VEGKIAKHVREGDSD